MKRYLYALLAAGFLLASCGFVVAERHPDAVKAQYPAKVDLSGSTGTIKGVVSNGEEMLVEEAIQETPKETAEGAIKGVKLTIGANA